MPHWVNKQSLLIRNTPIEFIFVDDKSDLPTPVGWVIMLEDNYTYYFTKTVDLEWDRLVWGQNTTILWSSSENSRLKSTGLIGTALITTQYSLPMRGITIEADVALNIDWDSVTTALDWFGVNFTDCANVWVIKNVSNFIMTDCALLNSANMTFDGTIGTVGFISCLFDGRSGQTTVIVPATANITRRFRLIYSSFVALSWETAINFSSSATVPTESYILDTVNFGWGATYLSGLDYTSNKSLFIKCVWITNTAVNGQLYMQGNATPTVVSATNTFYKILGTTSASVDNSKFTHTNNRLTCNAVVSRKYLIHTSLSFTSWSNNICEFGFYDSQLATIRTPSRTKATANTAWRAENVLFMCIVQMKQWDFLEIHASNTSAVSDITVEQLNFTITEIT